jgi:hypothetical protein
MTGTTTTSFFLFAQVSLSNSLSNQQPYRAPSARGDHFRFGSVWFLEKKETKPKLKKQLKPVQTDRFWLGSVF